MNLDRQQLLLGAGIGVGFAVRYFFSQSKKKLESKCEYTQALILDLEETPENSQASPSTQIRNPFRVEYDENNLLGLTPEQLMAPQLMAPRRLGNP